MGFKDGWKTIKDLVPGAFSSLEPFGKHRDGTERCPDITLVDASNVAFQVYIPGGVQTPRKLAMSFIKRFIAPYWSSEQSRAEAVARGGRNVVVLFWDNPPFVPRAKEMEQKARTASRSRGKGRDIGEIEVAHNPAATGRAYPAVHSVYPDTGIVEALGSDAVAWWKHDPSMTGPAPLSPELSADQSMGPGDWKLTYLHVRENRVILQRILRVLLTELVKPPPGAVFILFDATGLSPIVIEGELVTNVPGSRVSKPGSRLTAADVTTAVSTGYCIPNVTASTHNDYLLDDVGEADVGLFLKLGHVLRRWWANSTAPVVRVMVDSTDSDIVAHGAMFLERFLTNEQADSRLPRGMALQMFQRIKRPTSKRPDANYVSVTTFHNWARVYLTSFTGFDALHSLVHVVFLLWGGGCDYVDRIGKTGSTYMVKRYRKYCEVLAATTPLAHPARGDVLPTVSAHDAMTVAETDMTHARRTVFGAAALLHVRYGVSSNDPSRGREWSVETQSVSTRRFFSSVSGFGKMFGSTVSEKAMARIGAQCVWLGPTESNAAAAELEMWLRNTAFMVAMSLSPTTIDCLEVRHGMARWGFGTLPAFDGDVRGRVVRVLCATDPTPARRRRRAGAGDGAGAGAGKSHGFKLPIPTAPLTPPEKLATPEDPSIAAGIRAAKREAAAASKEGYSLTLDDAPSDPVAKTALEKKVDAQLRRTRKLLEVSRAEMNRGRNTLRTWTTRKVRDHQAKMVNVATELVLEDSQTGQRDPRKFVSVPSGDEDDDVADIPLAAVLLDDDEDEDDVVVVAPVRPPPVPTVSFLVDDDDDDDDMLGSVCP